MIATLLIWSLLSAAFGAILIYHKLGDSLLEPIIDVQLKLPNYLGVPYLILIGLLLIPFLILLTIYAILFTIVANCWVGFKGRIFKSIE